LTPFALAGVPLFLGWNPVGQVLSAREFGNLAPEELVLPLSAFVEDVLHGRPHSLNPQPRLGNAKWDAALTDLRRSRKQPFQLPARALLSSAATRNEPAARAVTELPEAAAPSNSTANAAELSGGVPLNLAPLVPAPDASSLAVQQLQAELDLVLAGARAKLETLAEQQQLDLDYSLESLRRLDVYLDQVTAKDVRFFEQNGEQLALIGIYLGDTVCHHAEAEWRVDPGQTRLSDALKLRIVGQPSELTPLQMAAELCADRSRSLFGHGVALCSGNWPA
jgi:hypothetical protein